MLEQPVSSQRFSRLAAILHGIAFTAAIASASSGSPARWTDPRIGERLSAGAAGVPVIVGLDADHDPIGPPEATLAPTAEKIGLFLPILGQTPGIAEPRPFLLQPSFSATVTEEGLEALRTMPGIRSIELDDHWSLHTGEGMELIGADILQTYGFSGSGTAVAIIDTGIDALHPSLGEGQIPNPKIIRGLDLADGDDDPADCSGHGTAVASIAAGVSVQWSPGRRFSGGVAPEARIFAYKVSPDDQCNMLVESAVIEAIEDAILHRDGDGYRLVAINISGGSGVFSGPCDEVHPALAAAVDEATAAGISVVASSGNEGMSDGITAPACIENVIAVGSVWDQNASATGSLFCLDAECTALCSDQDKQRAQPTCYMNSGPMLDVLAPSEYLQVAEAGGQTTAFGGTSGAAPYVTGGLALLSRARPNLDPQHVRHVLGASPTLVTIPSNHRTIPLLDLVSSLQTDLLWFGEAVSEPLLPEPSGPLISQAHVDGWGPAGSVRLHLRIQHPQPDSLLIHLRNPEGREVLVYDGSRPASTENALVETFPIDLEPVESLNAFIGTERHGTWELRILDRMTDTHLALLSSWSLEIHEMTTTTPTTAETLMFLPVAARGPGSADTHWTTDLRMFNPDDFTPVEASVIFVSEGENGSVHNLRGSLFLPARAQIALTDVLLNLFDIHSGAGQILLDTGDRPIISGGTIATDAPAGGSFGQFESGVHLSTDRRLVLPHLSGGVRFRTNLGLSDHLGLGTTATITIHDPESGLVIGEPIGVNVAPFSIARVGTVLDSLDPPVTEAYAVVESDDPISAWASVVDERTGDATFIPGAPPVTSDSLTIPVVARTNGAGGTLWFSDVRIVNDGSLPTTLAVTLHRTDAPPAVSELTLEPGSLAVMEDVVGTLFGVADAAGTLRIEQLGEAVPLAASSRTYNLSANGTYGQSIPAITSGTRDPVTLIGIDGSPERRTNVIMAETGGDSIVLEATLRTADGDPLADPMVFSFGPYELFQMNNVFGFLGVEARTNCRLDLRRVAGNGAFTALASVIDQTTGDAVAIPAAVRPN